ncbi:hypothetical protein HDC92_002848 [Pedobacter sp. AK017]|uniref:DUF2971 domain-containing protein n=1 Tax=Pedobacter sp. AK017 TaxID=2723073 RepID=UPI00162020C5|nr:DUF2971 domain-containing protein [Pedobacter sp. AK017]MBB5439161.1 hypothetical protein [Pedobacter sp. AK017]
MPALTEIIKRDVLNGTLPRFLYKYRQIDTTLERIISDSSLWFADPLSFNDPFDCQIQPDTQNTIKEIKDYISKASPGISEPEINKIVKSISDDPDYWPSTLEKIIKKSISSKGICCFASHNLSVLMWSHYANCHKGISMKFDVTLDLDFFVHPIKVNYSNDYPVYNHIRDNKNLIKLLIQNKSSIWNYEEEVRILKDKVGANYFKKEALVEITFGSNCPDDDMKRIRKLMLSNGYDNTIFMRAKTSKVKYSLEFEKF